MPVVDDNPFKAAMTSQRVANEALGCNQIAMFAEEEFDRVANAADCAIEVCPPTVDLDVCLVDIGLPPEK